jgi:hypothetical protein
MRSGGQPAASTSSLSAIDATSKLEPSSVSSRMISGAGLAFTA